MCTVGPIYFGPPYYQRRATSYPLLIVPLSPFLFLVFTACAGLYNSRRGCFFLCIIYLFILCVRLRSSPPCRAHQTGHDDGDEAGVPHGDHLHGVQPVLLLLFCLDEEGSRPAARGRVADLRRLPGEGGQITHQTDHELRQMNHVDPTPPPPPRPPL